MGQICHHFSWKLDYLLWEVDWRIVQRMLIDAPNYDSKNEDEDNKPTKGTKINLKEQKSEDLIEMLKQFQ